MFPHIEHRHPVPASGPCGPKYTGACSWDLRCPAFGGDLAPPKGSPHPVKPALAAPATVHFPPTIPPCSACPWYTLEDSSTLSLPAAPALQRVFVDYRTMGHFPFFRLFRQSQRLLPFLRCVPLPLVTSSPCPSLQCIPSQKQLNFIITLQSYKAYKVYPKSRTIFGVQVYTGRSRRV